MKGQIGFRNQIKEYQGSLEQTDWLCTCHWNVFSDCVEGDRT